MSISSKTKMAAGRFSRTLQSSFEKSRQPTVAYIQGVTKDSGGHVVGAQALIDGVSSQEIKGVPYNAPIGKGSRVLVENVGSLTNPIYRMTSHAGGVAYSPMYASAPGGNPIVTPTGVVSEAPNYFLNGGMDFKEPGSGIPIGWKSSNRCVTGETMGED